jgi:hypothetical protein
MIVLLLEFHGDASKVWNLKVNACLIVGIVYMRRGGGGGGGGGGVGCIGRLKFTRWILLSTTLNWQVQAPWLEALVNHGGASLDTLNGAGGGEEDELKALGGGRRRVFKTHAPFGLMPCVDLAGSGAKVIYVARNPKDACVSAFYHNRAIPMHEYDGPWDNFCGLYLEVSGDSFPWRLPGLPPL